MRLLTLALLLALPQDEPSSVWRKPMSVVNHSDETLPAGTQIALKRPRHAGRIEVRHGDLTLPAWVTPDKVWFRTVADIKDYEIDRGYEIRYGAVAGASRPSDVFEFFDELGEKAPDPAKWELDPALKTQPDMQGAAVTRIPKGRTALNPVSMILKPPPGERFIAEAEVRWELREDAFLNFSMRLELEEEIKTTEEARTRGALLISKLADDDLAVREEAFRNLVKLGRPAVPQLMKAARGEDGEVRARAAKAIDAIHSESPPTLIQTGFTTETKDPGKLAAVRKVGLARYQAELLDRKGSAVFTITRSAGGWTEARWGRQLQPEKVPGKIGRIRFDFWGDAENFGAVWVKRVIVRRDFYEYEAILGNEEKVP